MHSDGGEDGQHMNRQDGTGEPGERFRDTAQVDLRQAPAQAVPVRDTQVVGAPPPPGGAHPRPHAGPLPSRRVPAEEPVPAPADAAAQMRTVQRHLDEILAAVPQPDPIELAVLDAQGLLCAEDVVSQRALPAFDQAALDGYAARAADVASASVEAPVELAVVGESAAGADAPSSIGPGLALKVAAGAMLPAGADVVVPAVWTDQGTARVAVQAGLAPGGLPFQVPVRCTALPAP